MTPPARLRLTTSSLAVLLSLAGGGASAQVSAEETIYLELWRPATDGAPESAAPEPAEPEPRILVALGPPSAAGEPIAHWCAQRRADAALPVLPRPLLRQAPYDVFTSGAVPLRLELAVDDVEVRYLMGTERPTGASGLEFPFFELCPLGFGRRSGEGWAVDILHLANHRGDEVALAVYQGALPESERSDLERQLDYSTALEDPGGVLALGRDREIQMLLLAESTDGEAFDRLRRRIMR